MKTVHKITFASLLCFGAFTGFAQDNSTDKPKAQSFIGFAGGYSMMSGNITKTDYQDNSSGFAQSAGYNLALEGAYYLHPNWGIGGVFSMHTFYTQGSQNLADGYKDAFSVDSFTVKPTGSYQTMNFMVGPYFSYPFGKFTLDVRAVFGLTHAVTPKWEMDIEHNSYATFYQNSVSANAFGMQFGAGLRYSIVKNLAVALRADYFYAKPSFTMDNINRPLNVGRLVTTYNESMACLNFNLAIAYQFGK